MKIECRIKRALKIKSPAPYRYCYLGLNPENKKRCERCKHFKASLYYAEVFKGLTYGISKGVRMGSEQTTKKIKR